MSHLLDSRKEECLDRAREILSSSETLVEGLLRVIVTYSRKSRPRRAIMEWKYHRTSSDISCICGQKSERCHVITNKITGNILHLGDPCIGKLNASGWLLPHDFGRPTFYHQILQLRKQHLYLQEHILDNKPLQYTFCRGCCCHRIPIHLINNELCEDCRTEGAPLQDVPLLDIQRIAPQLLPPLPSPRVGLSFSLEKKSKPSVKKGGELRYLPESKRQEFKSVTLSFLKVSESLQECILYDKWPLYTIFQSTLKPHPELPSSPPWDGKILSERALDHLDDDLRPVPQGYPPYRCRRCNEEKVVPEEYGHCWRCCKISCLWDGTITDPHWIEMNQHRCRVSAALSYIDPFGPPPQWGSHRCELCLGYLLRSDPWMIICRACINRTIDAASNKPPPPPPSSSSSDNAELSSLPFVSRKRARIDCSPEECDDFLA